MVVFRKRLKERRQELGLTQEQVGINIYLSKGEISAYETGKRIPPLDALIRLSNFLELDFLWLIGMELKQNKSEDRIVNLSEDDLKIISALKKDSELYEKFIQNPERIVNQISNTLK